jgi:predicted CXXCH cytochrome family protein
MWGSATFLVTGTITSITDNGDGTTTFGYSNLVVNDTDWTDPATWAEKRGTERGLIMLPNTNDISFGFEVVSADAASITVKGSIAPFLRRVKVGYTFALIYGQAINTYIPNWSTPNPVRFFDKAGEDSFAKNDALGGDIDADGNPDDSTPNGVCQVCHTQTGHWRSDGTRAAIGVHATENGSDCIRCHRHEEGFLHGGGGGTGCDACHGYDGGAGTTVSHSTHTENDADDLRGPYITCDVCHDTSNFPYFRSGTDSNGDGRIELSETDVCDNCHSPGGSYDGVNDPVIGAKANWREGVYSGGDLKAGKEKWCAGCHDEAPGNSRPDGTGIDAPNKAGDNTTYGYYVTGHGRTTGNYARLSWQETSATGNPAAGIQSCTACHDGEPSEAHIDHVAGSTVRLKSGYENDQQNTNCSNCHPPGAVAVADPQFYTNSSEYENSAHAGRLCTECHEVHGATGPYVAMTKADKENLCFQCHTDGIVQNDAISNNRPGGYISADDIQEAFSKSTRHDLGTVFTVGGKTYELQCTSCHNIHIVTGKYWDAPQNKSPVTRFTNNTEVWGDDPGEKMNDFAALGSGSGGWYYSKARGGIISFDQPAVYQPPKQGSGYNYEFGGDILPDYATFCLDCHSYRVVNEIGAINWGQGISCNYNDSDWPGWVTCNAPHGLDSANRPYYGTDPGTVGSNGNPDPIFSEPGVTRGRGSGHWMRWPYESASRNAGINFVMACTDCHEAHGSNRGGMIRERLNVNANGDCGTGGNSNPDGENCTDGGNWNSFCNICHYYYGGQHAGMSCGTASCHERNSIHRIKKNGEYSGGTYLWSEPSRPTTTPEIEKVEGNIGSNILTVTFTEGVWTNMDQTGALQPEDFLLTDVNNDNPKTITNVTHTPGSSVAVIIMSAPLIAADIGTDLLATRGISIWDADGEPAGPWPVTIPTCPSGEVTFQLNESAGNTTASDESGIIIGTVNDPVETFLGDGNFHGDGIDNYIAFENNDKCLQASRALTLEVRIKPSGIGTDNYIKRILARDSNQNYQLSVWRNNNWSTYNAPDGVASIAFWFSPVDKHGGKWWKVVMTDYSSCPIVSDHWYRIKVVWNSDKTGCSSPPYGCIPADIFVDDQGTDGSGAGENWSGYKNCTDWDQSQLPDDRKIYEGDEITTGDGDFTIGVNVNNHTNNLFNGLIDWIIWQDSVDYSGVDDPPMPP